MPVLAGILLPSATVFLLIRCNDKAVLGPWLNRPWLSLVASIIVGVLVVLSLILAATTLFPAIDAILLTEILFGALVAELVVIGLLQLARMRNGDSPEDSYARVDASTREKQGYI